MTEPRMIVIELENGERKSINRFEDVPSGARVVIDEQLYYPSHVATDFTIIMKRTLSCLPKWVLRDLECR